MDDNDDVDYEPPPEWVLEVPEDLDSCIAQRHFEEAYHLLEKAKAYLADAHPTPHLTEMKTKIHERANSLVDVLTKELELSAEARSLQGGGLRSARRAVRLLIQLDRSAQGCQLYLKLCSAALKARLKRVKREGATVPYIKQLSAIAFSNIVDTSQEFLKIFPDYTNCTSGNGNDLIPNSSCQSLVKVFKTDLIDSSFFSFASMVQSRDKTSYLTFDQANVHSSSYNKHFGRMHSCS